MEMRKERLENLSLYVRGESERRRYSDERVLQDGLTFMSLRRYCGSEEWRLCVMEIILYCSSVQFLASEGIYVRE